MGNHGHASKSSEQKPARNFCFAEEGEVWVSSHHAHLRVFFWLDRKLLMCQRHISCSKGGDVIGDRAKAPEDLIPMFQPSRLIGKISWRDPDTQKLRDELSASGFASCAAAGS